MNKFIGLGRWTKPIELRYTQSGKARSSGTIAINEGYGDKQTTTFLNVVMWNKLAEICAERCSKGQQVLLEGKVSVRNYDDKEGRKVYVTEIVADSVQFLGGGQQSQSKGEQKQNFKDPFSSGQSIDIDSDDLLF
jgi:single-strand DNA-binding protein